MKSILISIKPKHCVNILNGLKTIEIRKRFPKDYRGWVYIYCTKDNTYGLFEVWDKECYEAPLVFIGYHAISRKQYSFREDEDLSGKVVARFYCDNVEEIACEQLDNGIDKDTFFYTESIDDIRKDSCLDTQDLINYLGAKPNGEIVGKAIHISKLEIFDEPKELSEFMKISKKATFPKNKYILTRPPQSWCYCEVE